MRENNRKPIEKCRKKLPQFTTMNVIDGQAGLVFYSSLIFYSLTIDNILNIVVLLILAAVSISMLTGENGIITQAQDSKDKTEQAKCEELVTVAINGLIAENGGDRSKITPEKIAEQVNKENNRDDVTAEGSTFPTNILFPKEDREVGVNIELGVVEPIKDEVYDEEGLEEEAEKNVNLFLYEEIGGTGEVGATEIDSLSTKEARIIGMNPKYCNNMDYISEIGKIYENTNYEIILEDGTRISDTLVIPYQISGKYISGADENEMYKITEVSLRVMNADKLPIIKTIIYPNTIKRMGKVGTTVQKVVLSKNLKEIESGTFAGCNLTSITIPSSVTSIGESAFSGCKKLTNIEMSNSVISIGESAFSGCSILKDIKFSDNIKIIGGNALYNTEWYNNQPNGEIYIAKVLYEYKGLMPENTTIQIKDGTNSITDNAFFDSNNLINIIIPDSLTKIGNFAFSGCINLSSIIIPNSVTEIGYSAFYECKNLEMVKIPEGVINIENSTFSKCDNLTSVEIPNSIINIGYKAFSDCKNLQNITIPNNVISLEDKAFSNCTSIESIVIPSSVTSIGTSTFYNCKALKSIKVDVNNNVYDSRNDCNAIIQKDINKLIKGCKNTVIPKDITIIGKYAFSGCINLSNIEIPNSIINIEGSAFSECSDLKNIEIPSNVEKIESSTFEGCSSLTNINILSNITSIGRYAFYGCSSLKSIEIPSSVTSIGESAFEGCSQLTDIEIPEKVKVLNFSTFNECENLVSIIIPNSITMIRSFVFWKCNSLRTINYRGTEEEWNSISATDYGNELLRNVKINYNYKGE